MDILNHIKSRLRLAGRRRWGGIADATGIPYHSLRKLAYNDMPNPGLSTVQPLIDFFEAVDAGTVMLPEPAADQPAAAVGG
jgi:hypothetical protein